MNPITTFPPYYIDMNGKVWVDELSFKKWKRSWELKYLEGPAPDSKVAELQSTIEGLSDNEIDRINAFIEGKDRLKSWQEFKIISLLSQETDLDKADVAELVVEIMEIVSG